MTRRPPTPYRLSHAFAARLLSPLPADQSLDAALWRAVADEITRVVARKDGEPVRLYSRPGNDLTYRFSLIVAALARLRAAAVHAVPA